MKRVKVLRVLAYGGLILVWAFLAGVLYVTWKPDMGKPEHGNIEKALARDYVDHSYFEGNPVEGIEKRE